MGVIRWLIFKYGRTRRVKRTSSGRNIWIRGGKTGGRRNTNIGIVEIEKFLSSDGKLSINHNAGRRRRNLKSLARLRERRIEYSSWAPTLFDTSIPFDQTTGKGGTWMRARSCLDPCLLKGVTSIQK